MSNEPYGGIPGGANRSVRSSFYAFLRRKKTMVTQKLPMHAQSFLAHSEPHHSLPSNPLDFVHMLIQEEGDLHYSGSLPPIFAVLEALDTFPILKNLIATFPPSLQYAIKASLVVSDPYQRRRLEVLEMLFDKRKSIEDVLRQIGAVSPSCLFHHAYMFGIVEGMWVDPSMYRRELAFLFAHLSVFRLPLDLQQKMAISAATLSLTVLPTYSYWHLCSEAEGRLSRAMEHRAVLFVNGVILLKFNGKLAGVALQTARLADGTQVIEGCWYAPIDHRDEIRDAFDRGESCWWGDGEWTLLRALGEASDRLLLQAQTFAAELPAQFSQEIATFSSRKAYRQHRHESFE
jgi:hypothetical protein